jgi:SAM-dependent methyltransferase
MGHAPSYHDIHLGPRQVAARIGLSYFRRTMNGNHEHVHANGVYWDTRADQWLAAGKRAWQQSEPSCGIWHLPESSLRLLPADMSGMTAIELGCGTAYVSAWMARRGASVVGIDNSERQLATARQLAAEHGVALALLHGNAETVPYPDGSFDFAISEYGAAIWCDPRLWIPEARRLLRPGGELVFLGNTPLSMVCMPDSGAATEPRLNRDYFALQRLDWARRWPAEHVFKLRRR